MYKTAVVLGGGGMKGAYEMGVWKAFLELEISYQVVVGTSIGALNGVFMALRDYETAIKIWEEINYDNIFSGERNTKIELIDSQIGMIEHTIKDIFWEGGLDSSPLKQLILKYLDEDKLRASPIDYGLVTSKVSNFEQVIKKKKLPVLESVELMRRHIPNGKLCDYLMASAACYPIAKPHMIDDMWFIDGGYCNEIPVRLAARSKPDEIIVVDLQSLGNKRAIYPKNTKIRHIKSEWGLGPLFNFDKNNMKRNTILGYNDCMKEYERYEGNLYTFHKGECSKNFNEFKFFGDEHQIIPKINPAVKLFHDIRAKSPFVHLQKTYELSPVVLVTRLSETAGRIFEVDPTIVYMFEEFNRKLTENYLNSECKVKIAKGKKTLGKILSLISQLDNKVMTMVLTRMYINGDIDDTMWEIARVAPEAMGAALYLSKVLPILAPDWVNSY